MPGKHQSNHNSAKQSAQQVNLGPLKMANPFTVPMERRKQTLAVIFYIFMFLITPVLCVYYPLMIFFTTSYWW